MLYRQYIQAAAVQVSTWRVVPTHLFQRELILSVTVLLLQQREISRTILGLLLVLEYKYFPQIDSASCQVVVSFFYFEIPKAGKLPCDLVSCSEILEESESSGVTEAG